MRRSLSTILGLGLVSAIFMAVMSMFYLQQIPTKEDAEKLEEDIRRQHSLYLAAASDIEVTVLRPEKEGGRTGVRVVCVLRPDLRRDDRAAGVYLARIADSILMHPDWRGRISYATVAHAPPLKAEVTRTAGPSRPDPGRPLAPARDRAAPAPGANETSSPARGGEPASPPLPGADRAAAAPATDPAPGPPPAPGTPEPGRKPG